MNYTIDEGHPLYPLLQPILEDLRKRDEDRAAIVQELSEAQAQIAALNQTVAQLQARPLAPEAWEVIADKIIAGGTALGKFNVPYLMGGDNFQEGGLDCSGFTKLLLDMFAGTVLNRVSGDQASQGTVVPLDKLRKGDLLFFTYSDRNAGKPTHVGIYVGGGKMLHTNNDNERIHISTVNMATVTTARRLF